MNNGSVFSNRQSPIQKLELPLFEENELELIEK